MNKRLVVCWLMFLAVCVGVIFWRTELKYSLPTPVPVHYHDVARGSGIALPASLAAAGGAAKKPIFLHFFNPDCPCSRFNMPHLRSLMEEYGDRANFAVVLMTDQTFTSQQIRDRFKIPAAIPIIVKDSALAAACGVYSTPQAVIIDDNGKLFYRGNYNRARYCTDERSSFAKLALQGLLDNNPIQTFSPLALKAYGCQLPRCTQ